MYNDFIVTSRAPSFILKQELKVNPNKHYLYHQQKKIQNPKLELVYPNPPTATLLPLRPKTCIPRVRDATAHAPVIMDMFAEATVGKSMQFNAFNVMQLPDEERNQQSFATGRAEHISTKMHETHL